MKSRLPISFVFKFKSESECEYNDARRECASCEPGFMRFSSH